jgi:hypothetical protein
VKIVKTLIKIFAGIISFILIALVLQYVVNPKFKFPEPHPFTGDFLYNPYAGIDSTKWEKGNFHVHTRSYAGVTNGADNSNGYLDSIYRYFGYGIIGISDYQKINRYESSNKWFVPVYEHGYSYYKTHHLVLNAKSVSWLDLLFYENLDNKQFMINHLRKDPDVLLTIPHPNLRQAYKFEEFKHLSGYNCLEICNNDRLFTFFYDTILSAGHPVFLMSDDDAHNLTKIRDGIHCFNLINTDLVRDSILHSIKTGKLVGVDFNVSKFKNNEEKKIALLKLPRISGITLINDTLSISLSDTVKAIKFIGQNGIEKKHITENSSGSYFFRKEDTYIRAEVLCKDSTVYFFNPVFRYDGIQLGHDKPTLAVFRTWMWRVLCLIALLISIFIVRKLRN